MTERRRWAPVFLGGMTVLFLSLSAIGWWQRTAAQSQAGTVILAGHPHPAGAACLDRDHVLAGLTARGITATAEPQPFCVTPPGLSDWLALTPAPPEGTHIAFDINGCLVTWEPCAP
jgi:hypothetical protein